MEEKHDWHVFIVNARDSALCHTPAALYSPPPWPYLFYHLFLRCFSLLEPVSPSNNVRRYFSRYSEELSARARRHTTRRGIMLNSTQPSYRHM